MSLASAKVPIVISSSLICLALGVGAGVAGMGLLGYSTTPPHNAGEGSPDGGTGKDDPQARMAGGGGMMGGAGGMAGGRGGPPGGGGRGGPPGGGGGMIGGGGGGRGGPTSKAQLAGLVTKLDQLASKPLEVKLNDAEKAKVREQIAGLEGKDELTEEEAKKRLDALIEVLEPHKDAMTSAGYRWPGAPGGGGGGGGGGKPAEPPPNPFKDKPNSEHLKSLQTIVK